MNLNVTIREILISEKANLESKIDTYRSHIEMKQEEIKAFHAKIASCSIKLKNIKEALDED